MQDESSTRSFSGAETFAVVALGSFGTLAPWLQPLLLGQLAVEGRISFAQIGQAAMLEGLGMALGASIAGFRLKPENLKPIAVFALIISIFVNLATAHLSGVSLTAVRIFAGISAGLLSWIWVGLLARHPIPARLCSIFILIQSPMLMLISYAYSAFVFKWGGAMAAYAVLAAINAASLLLIPFIPARYKTVQPGISVAFPGGRGLLGLVAVVMHLAAVTALWVYIVPLARLANFSQTGAGTMVSFALGTQLAGGLAAGLLANRLSVSTVLLGGVFTSFVLAACIGATDSKEIFAICVAAFAFLWVFVASFHMPYLTLVDKDRRAAMQLPTAQLMGMAAGPAIASLIVSLWSVRVLVIGSCAMFGICLAMMAATIAASRPKGEGNFGVTLSAESEV